MANKTAYAIARESADDRTLQNQYDDIFKVAKEMGYEIVSTFGENVSGNATIKEGQDPRFIEDLRLALSRYKPDGIFCYSTDRMTRTTYKIGAYLNEFCVMPKIPFFFVKDRKWTIDPETKKIDDDYIERLSRDPSPQQERINIVARTRPRREKLGKEGYYIGHISDGYCVEESWGTYEDGRRRKIKKIKVDEERRKVIEDIYNYYLNGESTDKIAAILNAENVPTANKYRSEHHDKFGHKEKYIGKDKMTYERKNATWTGALVAQVLKNEWYKGVRHYSPKDENGEKIPYELHHPHIISPEKWDEVKSIREERKVSFRSFKESNKHIFLLSNLFFCGKCGCKMYGHYTGLNNHYYCSSKETKENKCGLKGICKENIEGIIEDILIRDAYANVHGDAVNDPYSVISFFKLRDEKKREYKQKIRNNEKIIQNLKEKNERINKAIQGLIRQIGFHSDNETLVNMYNSEIDTQLKEIENNKEEIVKCQAENRKYNRLLTASVNEKQLIKKIEETKDLNVIRQLFKSVLEKVYIFNTEKKNSVIRIIDKKGEIAECVYSASRLKGKYIPLVGLKYNEHSNLIELVQNPVLASDLYLCSCDFEEGLKIMEKLHKELNVSYTYIDKPISVDAYIELLKNSKVAFQYPRLEELSELAKEQKEYYRQWRKKYNTGNPTSEPYILHNETYDEIQEKRKKLYNRAYKIKNKKSLTEIEKKEQLEEIKKQLDILTIQVPQIKPRKKRKVIAPTTIVDDED